MSEIYQLPETGGSNNGGFNGIPFSIPIGNFGMGMNNGGWGNGFGNGLEGIITLAIVASLFGWGNGGFGGGGFGGGNGAAGFLANQMNNDSGRELLMNAITSQGEAGRAATQNLATMLGQDFNLVNGAVMNVQNALQTLALNQAVSVPQIINSIQSGNQSLSQQFCQCCCDQRLLTTQQGYEAQIRTIEQTNQLGSQADRNAAGVTAAINNNGQRNVDAIADLKATMIQSFCDVKEREMQSKIDTQADIITQLRNAADNANQTNQIIGYVNSVVAPIAKDVNDIQCRMPQTVPVQWPQLTAVNTTPYVSGGFYGQPYGGWGGWNGFFGGNGFGGNITF